MIKIMRHIANMVFAPFQWLLGKLFLALIFIYRYGISPVTPASCRFYPTCSEYAVIAIKHHGAFYGGWLTLTRILRCNPLFKGGYDPVPDTEGSECGCLADSACQKRDLASK